MSKNYKNIGAILPPPTPHMVGDGFRVHNFFPSNSRIGMQGMSPFFLMDYNAKMVVHPSDTPRGVGVHPHRGFETVTFAYQGKVAHHDSAGNSGVIGEGDVQWMTAGAGVLHKEYYEIEFTRKGGPFQMVQLWVNLPAKYKMSPAKYQAIERKEMGIFTLPDGGGVVEIVAGEYKGIKGPAFTFTPITMLNGRLVKGAKADFSFSEKQNTGILVVEGEIKINDSMTASEDHFVYFKHEGEIIEIEALKESVVLILSGEPINEPISSYGPFLMNTETEIQEAFDDYYSGKFGFLED